MARVMLTLTLLGALTVCPVLAANLKIVWDASTGLEPITYHIEQCRGQDCEDFVEIATTQETTYLVTDLLTSVHYRYRVRACDTRDTCSPPSAVKSGKTYPESIKLLIRRGN